MKRIKIGVWSIEKSKPGFGFDLYCATEIEVKKDGKKTGEKRIDDKRIGYNIHLIEIISTLAEEKAFKESETAIGLIENINKNIESIKLSVIEQIIQNAFNR